MDDMLQWEWGKAQRLTPRGEKASRESMWKAEAMRKVMGEALGIDSITDETMPALSRLLVKAYNTGNENAGVAKDQGWRTRPFLRMNEEPWGQYDDDFLRTNSSYPSGHTAFGWATALVFGVRREPRHYRCPLADRRLCWLSQRSCRHCPCPH